MQFIIKKNYAFLIEEKDLSNNLLYLMKEIYGNKSVLDKIKLVKDNFLTKKSTTILIK